MEFLFFLLLALNIVFLYLFFVSSLLFVMFMMKTIVATGYNRLLVEWFLWKRAGDHRPKEGEETYGRNIVIVGSGDDEFLRKDGGAGRCIICLEGEGEKEKDSGGQRGGRVNKYSIGGCFFESHHQCMKSYWNYKFSCPICREAILSHPIADVPFPSLDQLPKMAR